MVTDLAVKLIWYVQSGGWRLCPQHLLWQDQRPPLMVLLSELVKLPGTLFVNKRTRSPSPSSTRPSERTLPKRLGGSLHDPYR